MLFNSYAFLLLFAPAALAGYWLLRDNRVRLLWLLATGYVFYASFDWRFVPLLLVVTLVNYFAGAQIAANEGPGRNRWLFFGLLASLGMLAVFKYYNFGAATLNALFGGSRLLPLLRVALPVGVSFYTFQALTYTLDLHQRRVQPARSLLHFGAFVAFFPTVLAGPITRWRDLGSRLSDLPRRINGDQVLDGVTLFVLGLVKKLLVADVLAAITGPQFAAYETRGFLVSWIMALAFGAQLYFDFSGYSDMAVGLGRLLGLPVPRNFALPYQAPNIALFWNCWHITLSTWFRDYLFFPLSRALLRRGDSQHPALIRAFVHVVTMGLIGLWHGAGWTFVLWGLYHAILLIVHAETRTHQWIRRGWVSHALTFIAVQVGWVLFNSASLEQAGTILGSMAGLRGIEPPEVVLAQVGLIGVLFTLGAVSWLLIGRDTWDFRLPRRAYAAALLGALAALCLAMLAAAPEPFLYFQF